MPKKIDRRGEYWGRLYVLRKAGKQGENVLWLCLCECGAVTTVQGHSLVKGSTSSCGCLHRENSRRRATRHGRYRHTEHNIWKAMRQRCGDPNAINFAHYGGRGITVCDRWRHSFENFLSDMGPRPDDCSLDRIDNDKGYGPDNCHWATRAEQARNTRRNHWITVGGETLCLEDWANRVGISQATLCQRIRSGWPPETAVTTPLRKRRGRCRDHR
jgi:hypothetical protein